MVERSAYEHKVLIAEGSVHASSRDTKSNPEDIMLN